MLKKLIKYMKNKIMKKNNNLTIKDEYLPIWQELKDKKIITESKLSYYLWNGNCIIDIIAKEDYLRINNLFEERLKEIEKLIKKLK